MILYFTDKYIDTSKQDIYIYVRIYMYGYICTDMYVHIYICVYMPH